MKRYPQEMDLRRTHLYDFHKAHGHMVEFAGFEMPLWYQGVTHEHLAVRNSVGIFDVTHMGRSLISGKDAGKFLDHVTTRKPSSLRILRGHYTVMCNENGGIVDDITVFRLKDERFLIVYNAANRVKDCKWLLSHVESYDVNIEDLSDRIPMFALQGPRAAATLQKLTSVNVESIKRYHLSWLDIMGVKVLTTRSGYTGEDGFELYLWDTPLSKPENAIRLWNAILEAGEPFEITPCGLGARDTLRLEAGMNLYGNDIDEDTTPFEAGLSFLVKLDKEGFIGREALLVQKERGVSKMRVGLKMIDRAIPRRGCPVYRRGERVGIVTSGTFSPLLKCGIALGYVAPGYAEISGGLDVEIRGRLFKAEVVKTPFYDTERYGWKRRS